MYLIYPPLCLSSSVYMCIYIPPSQPFIREHLSPYHHYFTKIGHVFAEKLNHLFSQIARGLKILELKKDTQPGFRMATPHFLFLLYDPKQQENEQKKNKR